MIKRPKRCILFVLASLLLTAASAHALIPNGDFENGGFAGWTADPAWVVVDNGCGYYSGWQGKY